MKDFPPDTIAEGGLFSPAQYSPLSSLIERARLWINQSRVSSVFTISVFTFSVIPCDSGLPSMQPSMPKSAVSSFANAFIANAAFATMP